MKLFDEISNIYILVEPCDLRKGIEQLSLQHRLVCCSKIKIADL